MNSEADECCLQIVIYYRIQWFPFHINDFAPLYFYYDAHGRFVRLLYDKTHHTVGEVNAQDNLHIVVYGPWHGYRVNESHWAQRPLKSRFRPLTDAILRHWWLITGKPQFKLRSKFVNPWDHRLFSDRIAYPPTFRDEAPCPNCGEVFHLDTMDQPQHTGIFQRKITCSRSHTYLATYNAFTQLMVVQ